MGVSVGYYRGKVLSLVLGFPLALFSVYALRFCGKGTGIYVEGVRLERTAARGAKVSFMIFNSGNWPSHGREVECRVFDASGRAVAERRLTVDDIDARSAIRQNCAFDALDAPSDGELKTTVRVL